MRKTHTPHSYTLRFPCHILLPHSPVKPNLTILKPRDGRELGRSFVDDLGDVLTV